MDSSPGTTKRESVSPEVLKAKVCLVGEASVGKTSLVRRFVYDQFDDRYFSTIGAKVTKREMDVRLENREVRVVLTIWDIMGEPSFRELLKEAYFAGAQGILAVADLTRPHTFPALREWVDAARKVSGPVPLAVLGNKADLPAARGAEEAITEVRTALRVPFERTSAKSGENVEVAFTGLVEAITRAAYEAAGGGHPNPPPRASRTSHRKEAAPVPATFP